MAPTPMLRSLFTFACVALLALAPLAIVSPALAGDEPIQTTEIIGPTGSVAFGVEVEVLPNGNVVICDSNFSQDALVNVGAAYLYDGATHNLISRLTGTQTGDLICSSGITVLATGNFVVRSPYWDNGSIVNAGAVTFVNGETGLSGEVSQANSLVGSHAEDRIGRSIDIFAGFTPAGDHTEQIPVQGVVALKNGNYVVNSEYWDNGDIADAGASTWASGVSGISGVISAANSLVGTTATDRVGESIALVGESNYVVLSPKWDAPGAFNAGAATWVNGASGIVGTISAANSLVGGESNDAVGSGRVVLNNGNYVVNSRWHLAPNLEVGAVTWGNGATGITGVVSAANSLVGVKDMDGVGRVHALTNGNYVVVSPYWDNGSIADAGAVTWGSGTSGVKGQVSTSNSLYGTKAMDQVGYRDITVLANGNYVVQSPFWSNGAATAAGAATWADGDTGITGPVTTANSLYGTAADAQVGEFGHAALSNGNYVVCSPYWNNGNPSALNLGAATWGNGADGTVGAVSAANSLVGSVAEDRICGQRVTALENGNYVVGSSSWDNGAIVDAGAATWGDGAVGVTGVVSATNSLVGGNTNDLVGAAIDALANGNYVVRSQYADLGDVADVGAATWGNGTGGTIGVVSASNSLVGASAQDRVGSETVLPLANGSYVVRSRYFDHGGKANVGAITWARADGSTVGQVSISNSLIGSTAMDHLGWGAALWLDNGSFYLVSPSWLNPEAEVTEVADAATPLEQEGSLYRSGAVTIGSGREPLAGAISSSNSILGQSADGGFGVRLHYRAGWEEVVVAFYLENRVAFTTVAGDAGDFIYLPFVSKQD